MSKSRTFPIAAAIAAALSLGGCAVYEPAPVYAAGPVYYPAPAYAYPAYPVYGGPAYGSVVVGGWHHHHHWR